MEKLISKKKEGKFRQLTKIWLVFLVYVSLEVADHHLGDKLYKRESELDYNLEANR